MHDTGFVGYTTSGLEIAPVGTQSNAIQRSQSFEGGVVDERVKQGLRLVLRAGGSSSQAWRQPINDMSSPC